MTSTRDRLIQLVDDALGAKVGHDVGQLEVSLRHLEAVARQATALHAHITAQHDQHPREDTP